MKEVVNEHGLACPVPLEKWNQYSFFTVCSSGQGIAWLRKPVVRTEVQIWNLEDFNVHACERLARLPIPEDYTKCIWENPLPFLIYDPVTHKRTKQIGRVKEYVDEDTVLVVWVKFGHPAMNNVSRVHDYEGEKVEITNLKKSWDDWKYGE